MSGAGGQRVIIIPSHDLIIVRMGFWGNVQAGDIALNNALHIIMEAIN
jgi:hypothetical protein